MKEWRGAGREASGGFTTLELLVVIAIIAILTAVAVPLFDTMVKNNMLRSQSDELANAMALARSEAVRQSKSVSICASSSGSACDTSGWQNGWIVFTDSDGDGAVGGETIITRREKLKGKTTFTGTVSALTYQSSGFSTANTFTVCDDRGLEKARAIKVGNTGRVTVLSASDASGASCP